MNIFGKVSGLIGGKKQDYDDDDDSEAFPDVREHLIPEHLAPDQARSVVAAASAIKLTAVLRQAVFPRQGI